MHQYVRSTVSSAPVASKSKVVPTTSAKTVAKPPKPPPIPKKNRFVEFGAAKCWYEDRTWNDFVGVDRAVVLFLFALGECFL